MGGAVDFEDGVVGVIAALAFGQGQVRFAEVGAVKEDDAVVVEELHVHGGNDGILLQEQPFATGSVGQGDEEEMEQEEEEEGKNEIWVRRHSLCCVLVCWCNVLLGLLVGLLNPLLALALCGDRVEEREREREDRVTTHPHACKRVAWGRLGVSSLKMTLVVQHQQAIPSSQFDII